MNLVIADANIFIDLESGEILDLLFQCDFVVGVPSLLYHDELKEHHSHLLKLGLELFELGPEAIERSIRLEPIYKRTSAHDRSALCLAESEDCPLITGDRHLREAATSEGLKVYGTLWVGEQFYKRGLMSIPALEEAYRKMASSHRRLPDDKIREQLKRLRSAHRP